MKTNLLLRSIIGMCCILLFSCQQNIESDDEHYWRLGWRMTENKIKENYGLANQQFDSLLTIKNNSNSKFLSTGLEVKSELGMDNEINKIHKSQSTKTLLSICPKGFLKEMSPCFKYNTEKVKNKALQSKLIKMYINDQYSRGLLKTDLLKKYQLTKSEVILDSFGMNTDKLNRDLLDNIISKHGFPTKELVGKDAMEGVFLIIQHADNDTAWQKSHFANIENAIKTDDMDSQNYAYLYDRVRVNAGKKQLYGTQFSEVDVLNKMVKLAETENVDNLDLRRKELGMMPIEMYKRIMLFHAIK